MFGTSGIRGEFGTDVTTDLALRVGRALGSDVGGRVVVGRDVRTTSPLLADALVAGLRECGADVVRLGTVPTPTVARAVGWYGGDAGVVVTASHNPPADNGIKLWDADGKAIDDDQQARIARRVERDDYDLRPWDGVGDVETERDATDRHVSELLDHGPDADDSVTAVVDVGHGTGRLTATALRRAGCTVQTLNAEPDGSFPSRPSEPTADNCAYLSDVVAGTDADLGIAHDGDADRAMVVTESGRFVPGDVLLALFASDVAGPGDVVAVPIDTSMAVANALEGVGARTTYTRVGDGHVAARASEPDVVFGGEPSGAWIWPDETLCPDGPLAATKAAAMAAEHGSLDELVDAVDVVPIRRESVETEDKNAVVDRVREWAADRYDDVTDVDGVRVDVDDGWFLVRASGTQPLVRITAEADSETEMESLFWKAREFVDEAITAGKKERERPTPEETP